MRRTARTGFVPILGVACAALLPLSAGGQSLAQARAGFAVSAESPDPAPDRRGPSLAAATLASAVIPGAGQALLKSGRAFIYAGVEALGWIRYSRQESDGNRFRDRYRELSRVARAAFNPAGPGGDWDYYERMEKFAASGAYDRVPGGDLDPEADPATYNGSIWLLARQTYWRDPDAPPAPSSPEFQSALAFYRTRAVPTDLQWSWIGAAEGFQQYRRSVSASNAAFKRAEQTAGLIIANHILSAVDAYVSVRMRFSRDGRSGTRLGFTLLVPGAH
ncbi:MAG TPA: hypothetical protein VES88_06980 [Gemmatimonadaceae bacterium]|nr:hypothetical protein [Gemmatimonadaceae bacterium]